MRISRSTPLPGEVLAPPPHSEVGCSEPFAQGTVAKSESEHLLQGGSFSDGALAANRHQFSGGLCVVPIGNDPRGATPSCIAAALSAVASADPIPAPDNLDELDAHFRRCRALGLVYARSTGAEDWEGLFHEAYMSIVRGKAYGRQAWAYLPHRIRSRASTAYIKQVRHSLTKRLMSEMVDCTHGAYVSRLDNWHIEEALQVFLEKLEDKDARELLELTYCKHLSLETMTLIRGRGETRRQLSVKLHRALLKLAAIAIRYSS